MSTTLLLLWFVSGFAASYAFLWLVNPNLSRNWPNRISLAVLSIMFSPLGLMNPFVYALTWAAWRKTP